MMSKSDILRRVAAEVSKLAEEMPKPKRMSRAEGEALGLYHPISDIKLKKPVSAVEVKTVENPAVKMAPKKVISPEQMQGGVAVPLVGDRSAAGRILKELEGVPMDVVLEGGSEFMRANPGMGWASDKGVLTTLAQRIQEGAESGGDVYGVYTTMGPQSVDFSTMVTEALLKQLDLGALRKKDIKEFDAAVKAEKGQGGKPKAPNFPGLAHPELERILMEGPGGQRDAFAKAMAKAQFGKVGFPDVAVTRVGVTEPQLIDVPRGMTGFTVARMDPEARIFEESGHKSYPYDLAGEYVGGLTQMIPHDIMFRDYINAKRLLGSDPVGAQKSFELVAPLQYLDQEWLDNVMKYIEDIEKTRKKGGYAMGGCVSDYNTVPDMQDGGQIIPDPNPIG